MAINTTQSTGQILADQARQNRLAEEQSLLAAPTTPFNVGASNPIGLLSQGISTSVNALTDAGRRQAQQANLDRQNAIRLEQLGYDRSQDALANAFRQEQADIQQSNLDRAFAAEQQQVQRQNFIQDSLQAGKAGLADSVNQYRDMISENAALVRAGSEDAATYADLDARKERIINEAIKANKRDKNSRNDVDITALRNQLDAELDSEFKLSPVNQTIYDTFKQGQQTVFNRQVEDLTAQRNSQLQPVDPTVSAITQLKTDGKLTNGVNFAVQQLPFSDEDKQELADSANTVVTALEKELPELRNHPYRNEIIATAVLETPTGQGLFEDAADFEELGSFDENTVLANKIREVYNKVKNSENLIQHNSLVESNYKERIRDLESTFNKNIKSESDRLQLQQGLLLER